MKKIFLSGLCVLMLVGSVKGVSLKERLWAGSGAMLVGGLCGYVIENDTHGKSMCMAAAIIGGCASVFFSLDYFFVSRKIIFDDVERFLNGANGSSEYILIELLEQNSDDAQKASDIVESYNRDSFHSLKSIRKLNYLFYDIRRRECVLKKLLSRYWLFSSSVKMCKGYIQRLANLRESIAKVVTVIKNSDLYKEQYALQEADKRQDLNDNIEIMKARALSKIVIYQGATPEGISAKV